MQELAFPARCDDGSYPEKCALFEWNALMLEASIKMGQALNQAPLYENWMAEAGFVNLRTTLCKWPTNTWPKRRDDKTAGLWNLENTMEGLQGFTMAMFTRVLGWSPEAVEIFLINVRKDCKDRRIHAYWPV